MRRLLYYAISKDINVIDLHTSGHASIEALQKLAESCSPKKLIPIHAERPEIFIEKFNNVFFIKDNESINN